jgi:exodeoxyribonuclease VII small subunit
MASEARSGSDTETKHGVGDLSYAEAGIELDRIIEEFETGVVDVDRLVEQLERATDIVDELDRRLRRTRLQVEELVPRLEAIGRRDESTSDPATGAADAADDDQIDQTDEAASRTDGEPGGLF